MTMNQQILIDDLLIMQLRNREYAESLTTELGIRLLYDIPWHKMPYYRYYRFGGFPAGVWEFSSEPFKKKAVVQDEMELI